jgi:hypothetical protein
MKLPAILYLALLDRLGDSWHYGALQYPGAAPLHADTLALIEALPGLARLPKCSVRISA